MPEEHGEVKHASGTQTTDLTTASDLTQQNMRCICEGAVDEVCAAFPDARIKFEASEELAGISHGARMSQLLVNLRTDAVQHGAGTVTVGAVSDGERVTLAVADGDAPIRADALPTLSPP